MMAHPVFEHLLAEVHNAFATTEALNTFCRLPSQFAEQEVTPFHVPAADLMITDTMLAAEETARLRDAFIAASPQAQWRETYKGTRMGSDFMDKFGCYCLIGGGGPYTSDQMGAYVVYMPPGLYYPFHHHPAEELYYILAGEAEFMLEGEDNKVLRAGEHVFHPSNRPHATQTHDKPFMALVLWRGDLGTKPVLTYPEGDT